MSDERRKRPSYPWYPGDFKRDTAVQSCPFLTRSIWREMLDLMHDGEPYGHLTAGGQPIHADAIARICGLATRQVKAALAELEAKHVYSRTPEGVIYSRRMVRDEATRNARAEGGGKSQDNPNVPRAKGVEDTPKDTPKDTHEDGGVLAHARTCRAASANADEEGRFNRFWEAYPKKKKKDDARKAFHKRNVSEPLLEIMLSAIVLQRLSRDWTKDGGQYIPYPATWLNAGSWDDEVDVDPALRKATGPQHTDDWWAECQHEPKCETGPMHRQRVQMDTMKGAA
jgi:hypothetical protein